MPEHLPFLDADAAADLLTFAARAARVGDDAVRLQARAGTLLMTAAPLSARGLLDPTPTVLAARAIRIDPDLECDVVVQASALRLDVGSATRVILPDTGLAPAWAGISPPRSGWRDAPVVVSAATLAVQAREGIASVATQIPIDAGEDAVRAVRAAVWGAPSAALDELPAGVAFAALTLGFIGGAEDATVRFADGWARLTLVRGHVLVRQPRQRGLTPVRPTGIR
jgi:hypothetical protein